MNRHIRRWQKTRLSKGKRDELLRFNQLLYGRTDNMPAKAKSNSQVATTESPFSYVDENGITQILDPTKVKNLGDTEWAESRKLFPNATPCCVLKTGEAFNADGYPNILGQNFIMVEVKRTTMGDYGPSILVRGLHPTLGEISAFAPGSSACRDSVAQLAGIDLETGKQVAPHQFPFWARFVYNKGMGNYEGYFELLPAAESAD